MIHNKDKPSFDELVDKLVNQVIRSSKKSLQDRDAGGPSDDADPDIAENATKKPKPKDGRS
jgi:hypothetical protein